MLHFLKKYFFLFIILHFNEIVEINSSNDLFKEFKTKNPSCDVSNFIESSNINNHNSQLFLDDLTNFCSNPSIFDEHVRLICSIVFKQLDFICRLDEGIRPSMKNYGELYDLTSLCLLRKVPLINRWIEKTFLVDEKIQMNLTKSTICSKLTSFNETKHLVRFIYKIGSRLKLIDETDRTNLSLRRHRKRQNEPFQIDGDAQHDPENSNHGVKGDFNQNPNVVENVNVKNISEPKKGMPLGRVGEEPAVEQLDGRPKPEQVDAVAIYRKNREDSRNWVGGKNIEEIRNVQLEGERNPRPLFRIDPPSLHGAPVTRKRVLSRPLSSRSIRSNSFDRIITNLLLTSLILIVVYLIVRTRNKLFGFIFEVLLRRRPKIERLTRLSSNDQRHSRSSQSTHDY